MSARVAGTAPPLAASAKGSSFWFSFWHSRASAARAAARAPLHSALRSEAQHDVPRFDRHDTSSPIGSSRDPIGNAGSGGSADGVVDAVDGTFCFGRCGRTASTNATSTSSSSSPASMDNESRAPAVSPGTSRRRSRVVVSSHASSGSAAA